jgi:hypothetical protein
MDICRRKFGFCVAGAMAAPLFGAVTRPKLLVLVVIEQFRPETLEIVAGQLGPNGFKRFYERGACFPDCRHLASTFSASSIATLGTGGWPAQHGLVADSWYNAALGRTTPAAAGELQATTLAAQVAADPRSRGFVISLDETPGAIFAGSNSIPRFWINEQGAISSQPEAPAWLEAYNRLKPIETLHAAEWRAWGAKPDAPPLRRLQFDPAKPEEFINSYKASPFAQEAQFDFASELIRQERLGQGETFDFLCVIAGSSALLGYETGGRSPLMAQLVLRLDQHLGYLFEALTRAAGEGNFALVVTGAHGAPPAPDQSSRASMAVPGEVVAQSVQKALADGGAGAVVKYVYPFLYLDTSGLRDAEIVRVAAGKAAMELPEVAAFFTAGGSCSATNEWAVRFRNSFYPRRSGDVMLAYAPERVEDYGRGYGVSYGSLYNYDVRVPLFFYGPQFRPGFYESPVESVDVTATLARVLGTAQPSSATGRVLGEALSREP